MGERRAGHDLRLEAAQSFGFTLASCVCLLLSLVLVAGAPRRAAGPPRPVPDGRLNPNEAPAASLARLPGIGPTRARAIVVFRGGPPDRQGGKPVFRCAEDLAQVKGIGPATIDGIRPWLRFEPRTADANEPTLQ